MDFLGWMALAGGLLLIMALSSATLRNLPISTSAIYLALGVAIGPAGFGLLRIDLRDEVGWFERLTEFAVIVALFVGGLKLRLPLRDPAWIAAWRLGGPIMLATILGVAACALVLLDLPLATALILAAVLAPTDPVLAGTVKVSSAGDHDRMRYALSGEAGLNDGMAFPFVILGLLLAERGHVGEWTLPWALHRLLWAVPAGLVLGFLLGRGVGRLAIWLRSRQKDTGAPSDFLALALTVRADPGELGEILLNLSLNARDAMPDGGSIMVETWDAVLDEGFGARQNERVEPGHYTGIRVCDTGHGMDAATLAHIFEPFYTTKGVGRGTGLGLASVYGIIKQHGGYVYAKSAPGLGTTFDIYLPATDTAATTRAGAASDGKVGSGEVVLVVEDDELVRAVLVRALTETGFRVLPAANGAEALDIAGKRQQQVDAVITDLAMPGLRGRELAERLEQLRPGVPVLFVSGHADDEVARRGLLDPGRPFLQKPFEPEVIGLKVRELLDAVRR